MDFPEKHDTVLVRKASGEQEAFDPKKLERSLRNAGADEAAAAEILVNIEGWLYEDVPTRKIYSRAFTLLAKHKKEASLRYRIKQAMMEFGPSGYPFERFISCLFESWGYSVETGQTVQGCSVNHEMDVIATSGHQQHLVECKYSQIQGKHVSIQVPLYVHSRVNDIISKRKQDESFSGFEFSGWVVTNTRFSSDSIDYARYYGLQLLSWDYPENNSLKDLIVLHRLYPITVLSRLTLREKQYFIDKGIVVCSQLSRHLHELDALDFTPAKRAAVIRELEFL